MSLPLLIYSNLFVDAFDQLNRYWVVLNGDQQIPPVTTDARGYVGLKFSDDYTQLIYNVNVHNIDNVTGVYLYHGNDTQNASLVLDLLKKTRESNREKDRASDITEEGQTTGTISLGGVTKKDLGGALKGKSIPDLYKLMLDRMVYIVVETKDYPNGEIKGDTFVGMDDVFHDSDQFNWN
ncbi:MAG: CHRD domain-containing protein [Thermoproteota archaeon]|nr:CHRD domain-containing protein [Thermoproteota archaeon]